jgi:pimeloyl-ACP methyl ester carboxylesterase
MVSRLERRRQPAVGATGVALVVSAALLSVGVGVGVPWAARAGWSAVAAVGIAALVVGLAGALGSVRAFAAGRTTAPRRAAAGLLASVGLVLLVYLLAIPLLVTVPAPTRLGATPASRHLDFQDVTLQAADGTRMAAWWVPSRNGAAVVVRHGSGSTRSAVLDQAAVLARHGFGVLLTDARGSGASDGDAMAWGWYGEADLAAALDFLGAARGVDADRVAVLGLSMGGEEALGAAGVDGRIRAVVAEGVTGRSAADLGWLETAYGWRGSVTLAVHRVQTWLADALSRAQRPTPLGDAAALPPRRALLIVAGSSADEQHAARFLAARAPGNIEVWVVPGARHTQGLSTSPDEWERRVTRFLQEVLR